APPLHRRECASGASPPHRRASSASLPYAHPPPWSLASACEEERFAGRLSSPFAEYFKDKWCSSPGTAFASLVRAAITASTSLADLRRHNCIDKPRRSATP
ncbi:Os12g0275400, partial [Oryza sativa Japonica Group]